MTILLTMREDIKTINGENLESISKNWILFLNDHKIDYLLCPNLLQMSKMYIEKFKISKIVLTGGGEVLEDLNDNQTNRQSIENYLIKMSILKTIPLFGICRGMQAINNYFGGKKKIIKGHAGSIHKISLKNEEKTFYKTYSVNSYHDEGITLDELGKGLEATALSEENLVEAFSHKKFSIFGQMWHPERNTPDIETNEIFLDFLKVNIKK